jgi:hypothetical protein
LSSYACAETTATTTATVARTTTTTSSDYTVFNWDTAATRSCEYSKGNKH